MVDLRLVRIRFCIRLRDTFRDYLLVALLMASELAIFALHSSGVLEEASTERTAHNIVELL